ncbi:NUDIX hydrolase [Parafrankia elaeagni]|uniref:NUDIX hydrolase n=1 Tax=Parafrankia elaeagni TaxID=222534 RepID=UPI00035F4AE4|nr:NUDIX domain-containing protein [Parafrankia elaeagni]
MPITAAHIRTVLTSYVARHPEDEGSLAAVFALLDAGADLTSRREFRGHVTAGAVLRDPDGRVLLVRHRALDRWLLPGGHLEATDDSLRDAALRELCEETGIARAAVVPAGSAPVHVDVHPIPANPVKGEPAHQHIDVRFLVHTAADLGTLQTEEITAAAWRQVDSLPGEALRTRIATTAPTQLADTPGRPGHCRC